MSIKEQTLSCKSGQHPHSKASLCNKRASFSLGNRLNIAPVFLPPNRGESNRHSRRERSVHVKSNESLRCNRHNKTSPNGMLHWPGSRLAGCANLSVTGFTAETYNCHNIPGRRAADMRWDKATTRLRPESACLPLAHARVKLQKVRRPFRFHSYLVLLDCNLTDEE